MLCENQQSIIWQDHVDYNIKNDQTHCWIIDVNNHSPSDLIKYLDDQEIKRAQQFKFTRDRNSFICCHAILRILLSKYCNCDLKKITYSYNAYNKPALNNNHIINFNLSHSLHKGIIAITKNLGFLQLLD